MWWWAVAAAEPGRLSDPVTLVRQEVHLSLDPDAPAYRGTAKFTLDIEEKITSFHLHSSDLTIGSVQLSRNSQTLEASAKPTDAQMLEIASKRPLKPGKWVLEIAFDGDLREASDALGLYRVEHEGRYYITSQFEPNEARSAWPCFDEPAFKAPLALSIDLPLSASDLVVSSNAKIRFDTSDPSTKPTDSDVAPSSDRRTVTFEETKPISSYGFALAVGPYSVIDVPDMPVPTRILTLAGREGQAEPMVPELPKLIRWLQRWFGEPYPYSKLDIIAIPGFAFGAMENPGAIVMNEYYLAGDAFSSAAQRREMLHVVAHELGHMWFGNLVTLAWWDDLWLNESFAEWIGDRAVEGVYPEFATPMTEAENAIQMLQFDARSNTRPIRTEVDPVSIFETVNFAVYDKGSALLDSTESWLSAESFRLGVRNYLGNHRFLVATADDLFASMGFVAGKPVGDTLLPWLDRPGAPTIAFEQLRDGQIEIVQRRFLLAGSAPVSDALRPWPVVMKLRIGRPNGAVELRTVRITEQTQTLDLGALDWILPTADGLGYFTFTLSRDLDAGLLAAVYTLSPVERLRVAAAIRHGFLAGDRSVRDVLQTLAVFSNETDPEVISELLRAAQGMVTLARDMEDPVAIAQAEAWLVEQALGWLAIIGPAIDRETVDRSTTRGQLTAALADAGDTETRTALRALAVHFLHDPTAVSIDQVPLALEVAARDDESFGKILRARADDENEPSLRRMLLSGATEAGGFAQRRELLDWAIQPKQSIPDLYTVWFTAMERREDRELLVDWQIANHEVLSAKIPVMQRSRLARIGEGCDAARIEKIKVFYLDESRRVPGVERVVAEMEEELQICQALQRIHGPQLIEALSALASQ